MGDWVIQEVLEYFVRAVLDPLPRLLVLIRNLMLLIPDVTRQQPVIHLAGRSLGVVEAGYVLLVMAAGLMVMARGGLNSEFTAREVLQRAVLGFVMAHFATRFVQWAIQGTNAVIVMLAPKSPMALQQLDTAKAIATQIRTAPESIVLLLVLQVVIVVVMAVLLISWLTRFIRLALLAGLAPLALACHGLPGLDGIARAWWSSLAFVLITVLAQAAALQFGLEMLLDPSADLTGVATTLDHSDVLTNLLLVLGLLLVVVRMPTVIAQFVPGATGGGRPGALALVLRYTVLNRVLHRRAQPAGFVTRRLAGRFARRQQARGFEDGPTWSDVGQRAGAVGAGLTAWRRWPTAAAAAQVGPGRWTPGQRALVAAQQERGERRARLAGRPVASPAGQPRQQAPRVAGRSAISQQIGAAAELQMRRLRQGKAGERVPSLGSGTARPTIGRTAGNGTTASTRLGRAPAQQGRRGMGGPAVAATRSAATRAGTSRVRPRSIREQDIPAVIGPGRVSRPSAPVSARTRSVAGNPSRNPTAARTDRPAPQLRVQPGRKQRPRPARRTPGNPPGA